MTFSVIIPCYNEFENMEYLLSRIIPMQSYYDLEYVLVENGSTDRSKEYFQNKIEPCYKNISVVYVERNKGYGYGLQQGLKAAQGTYVGWIHADLQMPPEELKQFFEEVERNPERLLFLKGIRTNRSAIDRFFTSGQGIFNSLLFSERLYDIGAIPVIFNREMIDSIKDMPNDFSIELYVYLEALRKKYKILRKKVIMEKRTEGVSSWNHGIRSKLRQAKVIFRDSLKIKKGIKVE